MTQQQLRRRLVAALLLLAALSLTSLAAHHMPPSAQSGAFGIAGASAHFLLASSIEKRHDDGEELEQKPRPAAAVNASSASSPAQPIHHPHHDDHSPSTLPAATSQADLVPIPALHHPSSHSHHHGKAAPLQTLNETDIFWAKGPDALSYVEYDFAYGLGTADQLLRFTNASTLETHGEEVQLMGCVDGRWRTLLDEAELQSRLKILRDLQRLLKDDAEPARHSTLLLLHALGCCIACFILLPIALALRAANSSLAPLASLSFILTLLASLLASSLYKALTPKLYPPNSHGTLGWLIFWLSLACLAGDILTLIRNVAAAVAGAGGARSRLRSALCSSSYTRKQNTRTSSEEEHMLNEEPASSPHVRFSDDEQPSRHPSGNSSSPSSTLCGTPRVSAATRSTSKIRGHKERSRSSSSDSADISLSNKRRSDHASILRVVLRYTHVVVARSLPMLAFASAYTGLAVYTGTCRAAYINACLAHGIKGGIFFWYGLITFARFLGAYADVGWAWNKRPEPCDYKRNGSSSSSVARWRSNVPSAEWVECLVCFVYGSSNAFMERFGAEPGDPWTVKQLQHVGIAVMFAGAGLVGIMIETRWIRDLLSLPVVLSHPSAREAAANIEHGEINVVYAQAQPLSYQGSFNPFPALVIGVTGVAMAAHHQDYVYEVEIHRLWGNLLAGFAIFRSLTYFFLWLRPPSSILPSRPPTEALASFCLTAGGLVFMLSSEEVSFAAMRHGYDDMMAVLNVAVAAVALIFAWTALLLLLKAAAVRREMSKRTDGQEVEARRYATRSRNHQHTDATNHSDHTVVLGDVPEDIELRHFSASPIDI